MRDLLEAAVGHPVKVAAILLTHWHYTDGTAAWADAGAEVWGHEWLDRNRSAGSDIGEIAGFYQTRAIAQFAVLHPAEGPDAFPNIFRFTPEKLVAVSSYTPPTRLIANLSVETYSIAGEEVEVDAEPLGRLRQRRLLLPAPAADDFQLHGAGLHLQRLLPARRPVPQPGRLPGRCAPHGKPQCRRASVRSARRPGDGRGCRARPPSSGRAIRCG